MSIDGSDVDHIRQNMFERDERSLFFVSFLMIIHISTSSLCIPKTPCQCHFIRDSFLLHQCSHSLPDLPILNSQTMLNISEIIAREALIRWPIHLCHYIHLERLDLSGSFLNIEQIDLSCLNRLTSLNLSRTTLKQWPNISLEHLRILDLSSNQIEILHSYSFRSLNRLEMLFLENNPFKEIDSFDGFFRLSQLKSLNLISSNPILKIRNPFNVTQWIDIARQWNRSNRSLRIQTNSLALQTILPSRNKFPSIPKDLMEIIFSTLSNSTFFQILSAPKCHCLDLRNYQRIFSFSDDQPTLPLLYRTSTCLMSNGIIHARLFDQRTLSDLNCSITPKISSTSVQQNHSEVLFLSTILFICSFLFLFI